MSENPLRPLLRKKPCLRVIETVNALEAIIIRELSKDNKGFDALWFSGLCHAAWKGMPDDESMPLETKLDTLREIGRVSSMPLIADCDTGGTPDELCRCISELGGLVSAVVVEDKKGVKRNSLYGSSVKQHMEDMSVFADKLKQAAVSAEKSDIMLFARIESFICGETEEIALERAEKYVSAGAEGIVIHSICPDGGDAFAFAEKLRKAYKNVPIIMIPTVYSRFTFEELQDKGANIVIYANQLTRSAVMAMEKTAKSILADGCSRFADDNYCVPPKKILRMIEGEQE